jgi:hypothetical protein
MERIAIRHQAIQQGRLRRCATIAYEIRRAIGNGVRHCGRTYPSDPAITTAEHRLRAGADRFIGFGIEDFGLLENEHAFPRTLVDHVHDARTADDLTRRLERPVQDQILAGSSKMVPSGSV